MTQAPAVGAGNAPTRHETPETTTPNGRSRPEGGADTDPSREDKEQRERAAGDVADDLADFA